MSLYWSGNDITDNLMPSGTSGQTLYYNGSAWTATGNFTNTGSSISTSSPATFSNTTSFSALASFSSGIDLSGGNLTIDAGNFSVSGTSAFGGIATYTSTPSFSSGAINLGGTNLSNSSGDLYWGATDISAGSSLLTNISSALPAAPPSLQQVYNLSGIFNPGIVSGSGGTEANGNGSTLFLGGNNAWEPIAWNAYPSASSGQVFYAGEGVSDDPAAPAAQIVYDDWIPAMAFQFSTNDLSSSPGDPVTWLTALSLNQNGNADFGTLANDNSIVTIYGELLVGGTVTGVSGNYQFKADNQGNIWARTLLLDMTTVTPDYVFAPKL